MVICTRCQTVCRHWIRTPRNDSGRKIGEPEKHVSCPSCKEHWVYKKMEGVNHLVPSFCPQLEMFY